ncbi:hypothetical protein XV92_01780 [Vibrio metoecus]|uniref:Uncharacterized protein n=1 Tax=Vibrio metoecus TaxID=1481663 RepID=A0A0N8VBG9_VIBMT|nr:MULTISPECIES: hypothetical protein [Gammaproteobacteria]KOO56558.1 hypothetical protein WH43_19510 [Rheinheimera sp. KL1]KQB03963.1 hypothetical protein XV92_01780 [Vibrio metoecus]HCD1106131.1 hypothetical protein [Morganella morganii]
MNIKPERWSCVAHKNDFIVAVVEFEQSDIEYAKSLVERKIQYVDVHSPAGVVRNIDVIRSRLLAGKLADHAVAGILNSAIQKSGKKANVIEYDAIRTDDFKEADPYDLAIQEATGSYELEVRSSFCYKLAPVENIINKLSSYGFYTTKTKSYEPPKDFYWQVVFYNVPKDLAGSEGVINSIKVFENTVEDIAVVAYVVGGGPRDLFESEKAKIRSDQDGAFYHSISPISDGLDCRQLVNLIIDKLI